MESSQTIASCNRPVLKPTSIDVQSPAAAHDGSNLKDATADRSSPQLQPAILTTTQHKPQLTGRGHQKIQNALVRLTAQRRSALGARVNAEEQRVMLKIRREMVGAMEFDLYSAFEAFVATHGGHVSIDGLQSSLTNLQNARQAYSEHEDDYNSLEDDLNKKEYRLLNFEDTFYHRHMSSLQSFLEQGSLFVSDGDDGDKCEETSSNSTRPARFPGDDHPLLTALLSRQGDEDLVQEKLADLRNTRASLVAEQRSLQRVGLEVHEESLRFLQAFDVEHEKLKDELASVGRDVGHLRDTCKQDGLLDPFSISSSESYSLVDMEDMTQGEWPPSARDPLLVPAPEEGTHFSKLEPEAEDGPISTASYINEWLLHRLRRSSLEVCRLKSYQELQDLHIDNADMKDLILEWWSKDDAAKMPGPDQRLPGIRSTSSASRKVDVADFDQSFGNRTAKSDSMLPRVNRLSLRIQQRHLLEIRSRVSLALASSARALTPDDQFTRRSF